MFLEMLNYKFTTTIKRFFIMLVFLFAPFTLAQGILLEQDGYVLTQVLLDDLIATATFLAGKELNEQDKADVKAWLMQDFSEFPSYWDTEGYYFSEITTTLKELESPFEVRYYLERIYSNFHFKIGQSSNPNTFMNVARRYNPALIENEDDGKVASKKAVEFNIAMYRFLMLQLGMPLDLPEGFVEEEAKSIEALVTRGSSAESVMRLRVGMINTWYSLLADEQDTLRKEMRQALDGGWENALTPLYLLYRNRFNENLEDTTPSFNFEELEQIDPEGLLLKDISLASQATNALSQEPIVETQKSIPAAQSAATQTSSNTLQTPSGLDLSAGLTVFVPTLSTDRLEPETVHQTFESCNLTQTMIDDIELLTAFLAGQDLSKQEVSDIHNWMLETVYLESDFYCDNATYFAEMVAIMYSLADPIKLESHRAKVLARFDRFYELEGTEHLTSFMDVYRSYNPQVGLLQEDGHVLTRELVNNIIFITEFLAGQPLSEKDKLGIKDWMITDFPYNPPFWIKRQKGFVKTVQNILNSKDAEAQRVLRDNLYQGYYYGIKEAKAIAHLDSFIDVYLHYDPIAYEDASAQLAISKSRYDWSVLTEQDGFALTRQDFGRFTLLAEFLATKPLNDQDKVDLEAWLRSSFSQDPETFVGLREVMRKTLELSTKYQNSFFDLAQWREITYGNFYVHIKGDGSEQQPSFITIIERYNPVYEVNKEKAALLSQSLIDFNLAMYEYVTAILGEDSTITSEIREMEKQRALEWVMSEYDIKEFIDLNANVLGTWLSFYSAADKEAALPAMRKSFIENGRNWEDPLSPVTDVYLQLYKLQLNAQVLSSFNASMNRSLNTVRRYNAVNNAMGMCFADSDCIGVSVYENGSYIGGF